MNTRAYNIGFATADIVAKTVKSVPHALKTLGSFIKKDALTIKDGFTSFAAGVRQATKDNVRGVSTPHDEIKDEIAIQMAASGKAIDEHLAGAVAAMNRVSGG